MTAEILIIDDNPDIRNILNILILEAGYKTRVAANYNQALNEIDKKLSCCSDKEEYKENLRILQGLDDQLKQEYETKIRKKQKKTNKKIKRIKEKQKPNKKTQKRKQLQITNKGRHRSRRT